MLLHGNARSAIGNVVGEVNEKLSETALGGCIVTKHGRESGIPKRLGETLTQSLPGSAVVTQTGKIVSMGGLYGLKAKPTALTGESSAQRASVTLRSVARRAV